MLYTFSIVHNLLPNLKVIKNIKTVYLKMYNCIFYQLLSFIFCFVYIKIGF